MQLTTILNRVERHKSFVYGEAHICQRCPATDHRSGDPAAGQRPPDLLGLRSPATRLRPAVDAAV